MKQILLSFIITSCIFNNSYGQETNATVYGQVVHGTKVLPATTILLKNNATGFTITTVTNSTGEYTIKQIPLGGPYTIIANHIGYTEHKKDGYILNQSDVLKVDFDMQEQSLQLDEVTVSAAAGGKVISKLGAVTAVTSRQLNTLPVNGRNFTSLIDLSPLSRGANLSGQLFSSTNYTVDGMTSKSPLSSGTTNRGPYSISMEAIREFQVSTNEYDVTYGRAGGGTINTVTKAGTNTFTGSVFTYARTNWLSSPYDIRGNKINNDYSIYQYGFSLGGPIIKDKMHFFVAWDHQKDSRPLFIADIKSKADESIFNITQNTLDQFLNIARTKYGVANTQQFGSFNKVRPTDALFARVDWQLNAKNLLTIRNNFVKDVNNLGVNDNSRINLYEVYGTHTSMDNSFMIGLRTNVRSNITNSLKAQYLYTYDYGKPNKELPAQNIPRAIVQNVESISSDGKKLTTDIQIGGQRYLPEKFINKVFQLTDNVYYNINSLNFTFGADLMFSNLSSLATSEMNGRFYYTGIDNFQNNKPYRYAREVSLVDDATVNQNVLNSGLYAQLQTKLAKGLDMMVGIRGDYTFYFKKPNFNKTVYDELKLKTDNSVKAFQLQPRLQLTWNVNEENKDIIKFGAGVFGSNLNNYTMVNNVLNDGSMVATVDIQGANVPVADFVKYRQDPSSAPGKELFNIAGVSKVSTINLNGDDLKVPTLYKANLSYTHIFSNRLRVGATFYMALGRNNYMYVDGNMVNDPFFRLSNEGNRGVFVPANTINKANGATDWTKGRISNNVSRVLVLNSKGKVNSYSFVIDGTYRYYKDGEIYASYTWNDTKDNTSYNGNVANSATLFQMVKDDPRDLNQMSYSNSQFRNKIIVYGTAPSFYGITLGLRFSGIGGTRYSMIVNGNVNGDFVATNDLAYIFAENQSNAPAAILSSINNILANDKIEQSVKDYITNSRGKIVERNGGINRFNGIFDVRLAKKFKLYKTNAIEVSADIFNLANLIDKKRGITKEFGNINLYNIKGFDAANQQYVYTANENAGIINPSGNPYQIQLGIRYSF